MLASLRARTSIRRNLRAYECGNPYEGDGKRPAWINPEAAFDDFVKGFGGTKVEAFHSDKAKMPKNADYYFPHDDVLAEFKILEGSVASSDGKLLTETLLKTSMTGGELMGVFWRGENLPRHVWQLLRTRFRRYLESKIKDARRQLNASQRSIGGGRTKTIIIICNDNLTLFSHDHIFTELCRLVSPYSKDVDALIYLSINVVSRLGDHEREYCCWAPSYSDETDRSLGEFVNRLGSAWYRHLAVLLGEPHLPTLEIPSLDEGMEFLSAGRSFRPSPPVHPRG